MYRRWLKTQASNLSLGDVLARSLDVFGSERVLFGTDSGTFPAGWRADRYAEWSSIMDDLGLDEAERARFFHGNADRIIDGSGTA